MTVLEVTAMEGAGAGLAQAARLSIAATAIVMAVNDFFTAGCPDERVTWVAVRAARG